MSIVHEYKEYKCLDEVVYSATQTLKLGFFHPNVFNFHFMQLDITVINPSDA
jgi:hypothetical protein